MQKRRCELGLRQQDVAKYHKIGVWNYIAWEYIWLGALPLAVIADVDTASPNLYYIHVDHLNRPVRMTDGAKVTVWDATWLPHGGVHAITGTAALDARFPGQWFQLESGLHYNWHRHYDPTTGRYTQADPLGFIDGPSVYAYAVNSPQMYVDEDGRFAWIFAGAVAGAAFEYFTNACASRNDILLAAASGALGGGLGAVVGKRALVAGLKRLSINTKGRIGEALSLVKHRLKGNRLNSTQRRIPGHRTIADSAWRGRDGRAFFVESKFGTSKLTPAQRAAQRALGDAYKVDRWTYPWFGKVGNRLGGATGSAAGVFGGTAVTGECGCNN